MTCNEFSFRYTSVTSVTFLGCERIVILKRYIRYIRYTHWRTMTCNEFGCRYTSVTSVTLLYSSLSNSGAGWEAVGVYVRLSPIAHDDRCTQAG